MLGEWKEKNLDCSTLNGASGKEKYGIKSSVVNEFRRMEIGRNSALVFDNRIMSEWLNTKEAAAYLSISPNALRILVHREKIGAYKFGNQLRFRIEHLQELFLKKGVQS